MSHTHHLLSVHADVHDQLAADMADKLMDTIFGIVESWNGPQAHALRLALRLTPEGMVQHLGLVCPKDEHHIKAQGSLIKKARTRNGWSQTQFGRQLRKAAERLGRANELPTSDEALIAYISYHENGRRPLSPRLQLVYLEALHCTAADLGFALVEPDTISAWEHAHSGEDLDLALQSALDTALINAPLAVQYRFARMLAKHPTTHTADTPTPQDSNPVVTR
ncbi:helix-turn-helix domain-containing protein [Nonomuraea rubra]|uniref:helix-turn-helix domain-containing protein n=1 Tax=Nonomuraea rubra TaxID=46180 RepID=UPI0033CE1D9C